jgi:hypothetical protein
VTIRNYAAERFDALTDRQKAEAMTKADAFDTFVDTMRTYLGIRASLPLEQAVNTAYEPYCYSTVEVPRLPNCPTVPEAPTADDHETLLEILFQVMYQDGYQNGRADGSGTDRRASRRPTVALDNGLPRRMGIVDVPPEGGAG